MNICQVGKGGLLLPIMAKTSKFIAGSVVALIDEQTHPLLIDALARLDELTGTNKLILLIPPKTPPSVTYRRDGSVTSLIASGEWTSELLQGNCKSPEEFCYRALSIACADTTRTTAIDVVHGASLVQKGESSISCRIDAVIPHRGDNTHLLSAVSSLVDQVSGHIFVCFDQIPEDCVISSLKFGRSNVVVSEVYPSPAGPYVIRQHYGLSSRAEYLAFQDSDDISLPNRLDAQIDFARSANADVVGCHELRLDDLTKTVEIIRLPIDVNYALECGSQHAQLFPTTIIRTEALKNLGGLSTVRPFGSDRAFQLRAYFSARLMNLDAFLYIRRRRPFSLTEAPATGLRSLVRQQLEREWNDAFSAVRAGTTPIELSALRVEQTNEAYTILAPLSGHASSARLDVSAQ